MPSALPPILHKALQSELRPFERVLHHTQPIASRMIKPTFLIWFFAIPWTAFSLFWMYMASEQLRTQVDDVDNIMNIAFPLFGLPFVLIGLFMLSSPLLTYLHIKKMLYVITNKRLLIVTAKKAVQIETIPADKIENFAVKIYPDGSGNITFAHNRSYYKRHRHSLHSNGLYALSNVTETKRHLEKMLQEREEESA